jgi:hypothetical protein
MRSPWHSWHTGEEILVVSRPKIGGFGRHFGVDFQNGTVVHFTSNSQIEFTTSEGFACNRDVKIERVVPADRHPEVRERLDCLQQNPRQYRLGDWNCETFAIWLTEGKSESAQVNGAVFLAAATALLAAIR